MRINNSRHTRWRAKHLRALEICVGRTSNINMLDLLHVLACDAVGDRLSDAVSDKYKNHALLQVIGNNKQR